MIAHAVASLDDRARFAAQHVDHVVGDLAAVIVALVDNHAFLADLREEVAVEVGEAAVLGVGHIDVAEFAAAEVDRLSRRLSSIHARLRSADFAGERNHDDVARAAAVGIRSDSDRRLLPGGLLEVRVHLAVGMNLLAVDGEQ